MKVKNLTQEEKVKYMTTAPVPGLISKMAIPTIISMLVTSFYNMADTFFVGKIDTNATAAVGVVFSVMTLIQACGFLFGHGSGNFISRKLGSREFEEANVMSAVGFYTAFFFGVIFAAIGICFVGPLAQLLGATPEFLQDTIDYLGIILLGAPFMMSQFVLNNQLRYQGSASYAMVGVLTGAVINIVLDPILIFGFDLGTMGAAIATVIGQIISFIVLWLQSKKGENIQIKWHNFKPSVFMYSEICRGGIPSLFRQGLAGIASVCLNRSAGIFAGDLAVAAIAAMSVVSRISMFANAALIGFGQGFQPVCGMNYGAKKYDRVKEAVVFCIKVAAVFLIIVSILGFIFAEPLVTLFRKDDPDVIMIGTAALRFQCISFPLNAWIVICNMYLQSIGKAVKASIVAASRQGIFFMPLIWIVPYFFGLFGVEITQMLADIGTFLLSLPLGIGVLREMMHEWKEIQSVQEETN